MDIERGQIYKIADLENATTWLVITSTEYSDERDSVCFAIVNASEYSRVPYAAGRETHHESFRSLLSAMDAERIA